jgi:hypothetical protein
MAGAGMNAREANYYGVSDAAWLRPVLSRPAGALATHWLVQGILNMDRSERCFKIAANAASYAFCAAALRLRLPLAPALALGFVAGHSLSWLFNAQVWVVLKHFGLVRNTRLEFDSYVGGLAARIRRQRSIDYGAAYGSLARQQWSPASDLDVRLVRKPGWRAGIEVCAFAAGERSRAFLRRFPLDIFVLDSAMGLDRMKERDRPVVLFARAGKE